jgi:PAS domain S-box-containing protein
MANMQNIASDEHRWWIALKNCGYGVWDWNIETGDVFFSSDFKSQMGYREDEMADRYDAWEKRLHPDDRAHVLEKIKVHMEGQTSIYEAEYRFLARDGTYRWVFDRGKVAEWSNSGKPLRMLGTINDISERKMTEEKLLLSQFSLDHAPDAVYWVNSDERILYVNNAACISMGYTREEFYTLSIKDIDPVFGQQDRFQQNIKELRSVGYKVSESVHRSKGGRTFPVEINAAYLEYEGKSYICGIARDLTERKKTEEVISENARRLEKLHEIDQVILGGGLIEDIARIGLGYIRELLSCFRVSVSLFDYERNDFEIYGVSAQRVDRKDENPRFPIDQLTAFETLKKGQPYFVKNHAEIEDKNPLDMYLVNKGIKATVNIPMFVEGKLMGALNLVSDQPDAFTMADVDRISEMVNAVAIAIVQIRLREQNRLYAQRLERLRKIDRAILAASSPEKIAQEAVVHLRKVICCEQVAVMTFDYERRVCTNLATDSAFPTVLMPGFTVSFEEYGIIPCLEKERIFVRRKSDGGPVTGLWKRAGLAEGLRSGIRVALVAEGQLIGSLDFSWTAEDAFTSEHIEIAREISNSLAVALHQAHLREQIQKHSEELERRVFERTKQLQLANRELEAFSYSVSHDLRTPLRGLDGYSHILLEDYAERLDAQGKEYLRKIRQASLRMATLIDDMLKLSRVTRSEMERQSINLAGLARDAVAELRTAEPARQVDVIIPSEIQVYADPALLRIAMTNLISNSWKFTRKHATAKIEVGEFQQNDERVFFVKDDGAGFDMAYVGKIFSAFQRLHSDQEFEGTGIGLAIVSRIVQRHGGRIWAQGEVEKGATIYFTLP